MLFSRWLSTELDTDQSVALSMLLLVAAMQSLIKSEYDKVAMRSHSACKKLSLCAYIQIEHKVISNSYDRSQRQTEYPLHQTSTL